MLASRVIKYGIELRRQETEEKSQVVKYFKYKEKGHKYRECPKWKKGKEMREKRTACVAMPQKAQQKK